MIHPGAVVLTWLLATVTLQFLGAHALGLAALALLLSGKGVIGRWARQVRRARWLLLTLALVFAFGTPGEAVFPAAWAPTDAGVEAAGLHGFRLVLLLGLLALLFERLDRRRLIVGLGSIAAPLRCVGLPVDAAVVRLALVFEYLETQPDKGSWRSMLQGADGDAAGPDVLQLEITSWRLRDACLPGAALVVLVGLGALP